MLVTLELHDISCDMVYSLKQAVMSVSGSHFYQVPASRLSSFMHSYLHETSLRGNEMGIHFFSFPSSLTPPKTKGLLWFGVFSAGLTRVEMLPRPD